MEKQYTIKLYDPPSGWQYGFPKPYKPEKSKTEPHKFEALRTTLLRDGYPQKEIDAGGDKHVRFWTTTLDKPID